VGNLVITVPEMAAHCFALLHASGGIFEREKNIFGFSVINCIYWAIVRDPGRVRWDGLRWMGLDDDVPIRKALPFRDVLIFRGLGLLLGPLYMVFEGRQMYISNYDLITPIPPFPVHLGRREWPVDRSGWVWMSFKNGHVLSSIFFVFS